MILRVNLTGLCIDLCQTPLRYLAFLIACGDFQKAAELCPKFLKDDMKRWEQWVCIFAEHGQLLAISPFIPAASSDDTVPKGALSSYLYELVLNAFLNIGDDRGFVHILRKWARPNTRPLFDASTIVDKLVQVLAGRPSIMLREALAELYLANGDHSNALREYLSHVAAHHLEEKALASQSPFATENFATIFLLIEAKREFRLASENASVLFECNQDRAIELFVRAVTEVDVDTLMLQLKDGDGRRLLQFLHTMYVKRSADFHEHFARWHDLQVRLVFKVTIVNSRNYFAPVYVSEISTGVCCCTMVCLYVSVFTCYSVIALRSCDLVLVDAAPLHGLSTYPCPHTRAQLRKLGFC